MSSGAIGRGHGKLILSGEHAVVYGHPALAMAVDLGTTVTLTEHDGPTRPGDCAFVDERLLAALALVLPAHGLQVHIHSELPVGRGMGSSAALAVALVRAFASLNHEPVSDDEAFRRAFTIEQVFHGTPSGLDHAVSSRGGVLRFVRGDPPTVTQLDPPPWTVVALDSGSAGDTAVLVAGVRSRRPGIDPVLDRIGALTDEVVTHLNDLDTVGPLLTENHRLLQQIGVSTDTLDALVELSLGAGARGAKLSGAGGGGIVIAAVDDPAHLLGVAARLGIRAWTCSGVASGGSA